MNYGWVVMVVGSTYITLKRVASRYQICVHLKFLIFQTLYIVCLRTIGKMYI